MKALLALPLCLCAIAGCGGGVHTPADTSRNTDGATEQAEFIEPPPAAPDWAKP